MLLVDMLCLTHKISDRLGRSAAGASDVDRFWLTFLTSEPRSIDEDVFADILESTGWMPMDLQASLKRLIDSGRVTNLDARGKRVSKPLHYKNAERLVLIGPPTVRLDLSGSKTLIS
jgi:hypothetical protein